MTSSVQNLVDAMTEWRGRKSISPVMAAPRLKNPVGVQILKLNTEWGERKRELEAQIEAEKEKYLQGLSELNVASRNWEYDNADKLQAAIKRGPQRVEHSDEVKKAAALCIREGQTRTLVRTLLGVNNTQRLDEILRQGEYLLQADEATEKKTREQEEEQW